MAPACVFAVYESWIEMGKARNVMPAAMTAGALAGTALTLAHSLRWRGGGKTAIFAALGMGLPLAAEYTGVNLVRIVRHRTYPQIRGVPLAAIAWYNIGYATHALAEGLVAHAGVDESARRWATPTATAALATSLDLIFDCFGLDLGLWEWRDGGPYARDIVGPNGKAGIPIANFSGWVALTGSVSLGYELLAGKDTLSRSVACAEAGPDSYTRSARTAAILLTPYYITSAAWALARRKPRYLAYSALVPTALLAGMLPSLAGHEPRTRRARAS